MKAVSGLEIPAYYVTCLKRVVFQKKKVFSRHEPLSASGERNHPLFIGVDGIRKPQLRYTVIVLRIGCNQHLLDGGCPQIARRISHGDAWLFVRQWNDAVLIGKPVRLALPFGEPDRVKAFFLKD